MYGQIHVIVRDLVKKLGGEDTWKDILKESGANDIEHFMVFHLYPDELTFKVLGHVCEKLGVELVKVLEVFGEHFLIYCYENGYDKMLLSLGEDFRAFMQNLDSLHALLALTYEHIDAPSFRCEPLQPDGSMNLHYYSARPGLYPIVTGLLRAVGRELFKLTNVESEIIKVVDEKMVGDTPIQHVVFHVWNILHPEELEMIKASEGRLPSLVIPSQPVISVESMVSIFSFHVVFDKELIIRQVGVNIQRMSPKKTYVGRSMCEIFNLTHPIMPLTIDFIMEFINAAYVMEVKETCEITKEDMMLRRYGKLTLRGAMEYLADSDMVVFFASPRLDSLNEMIDRHMFLSDIPLFDVNRELVLLNQQRIAEIEVSKKLDEAMAEQKRLSIALDAEKQKTDRLLYQMLPRKVADSLRDGKKVEAEKFPSVTIFFSDVVTFTNICAAVTPIDVVNMLNNMYMKFDSLTEVHDVYKVETIGDAYMVVSGVPEINDDHMSRVTSFAVDMIGAANSVCSPATGLPLQIRVGVHTGSVVAGVVGEKMPRYCLFGDTVNTASRMESHGVPNKVHISPFTHEAIMAAGNKEGFVFVDRGEIEVKGKGKMHTYFVKGNKNKMLKFPEEEEAEKKAAGAAGGSGGGQPKDASKPTGTNNSNSKCCSLL